MKKCVCGNNSYENEDIRAMRRNSLRIDKELKRAASIYQSTIKLLLLGPGESGKSTVLKQMRIIHTSKFTDTERRDYVQVVKSNIRDIILCIVNALQRYDVKLDSEYLKNCCNYIIDNATRMCDFCYTDTFWDCVEALWCDEKIKRFTLRGTEYNLLDSANYFLDRVYFIRQSNYLPNDQDILRCRVLTTGIIETEFEVKHIKFHLFDVGGQRDERRKWIQCFNEVTAVIFVADISAFNMTLREDTTMNRLQESLDLFRSTWVNRWLSHVSIILFLNKYDILVEKIESGLFKLETYFPDYNQFEISKHVSKSFRVENENPNVTRAKMFILKKFMDITCENVDFRMNKFQSADVIHTSKNVDTELDTDAHQHQDNNNRSRRSYETNNVYTTKTNFKKFCIPYFTCAVDTENIKRVFKGCYDILQREHLEKCGLIT